LRSEFNWKRRAHSADGATNLLNFVARIAREYLQNHPISANSGGEVTKWDVASQIPASAKSKPIPSCGRGLPGRQHRGISGRPRRLSTTAEDGSELPIRVGRGKLTI